MARIFSKPLQLMHLQVRRAVRCRPEPNGGQLYAYFAQKPGVSNAKRSRLLCLQADFRRSFQRVLAWCEEFPKDESSKNQTCPHQRQSAGFCKRSEEC